MAGVLRASLSIVSRVAVKTSSVQNQGGVEEKRSRKTRISRHARNHVSFVLVCLVDETVVVRVQEHARAWRVEESMRWMVFNGTASMVVFTRTLLFQRPRHNRGWAKSYINGHNVHCTLTLGSIGPFPQFFASSLVCRAEESRWNTSPIGRVNLRFGRGLNIGRHGMISLTTRTPRPFSPGLSSYWIFVHGNIVHWNGWCVAVVVVVVEVVVVVVVVKGY